MKYTLCLFASLFLTFPLSYSAAVERSTDSKTECRPAPSRITNGYENIYYANTEITPSKRISQLIGFAQFKSHTEQIHDFIKTNQIEKLRAYLARHKAQIAINAVNSTQRRTFLKHAISLGNLEIVRMFIEEVEADQKLFLNNENYITNADGIIREIKTNNIVYYNLLNAKTISSSFFDIVIQNPPIFTALYFKHYPIMSYLIRQGATVTHNQAECTSMAPIPLLNCCLPDRNLLTEACYLKRADAVEWLLTNHIDKFDVNAVDRNGNTPLTTICLSPYTTTIDDDGALRLKIVNLLVQHKANINKKNNEGTPLYLATQRTYTLSLAKRLLELGANPNIPSGDWRDTPLQMRLDCSARDPQKDCFLGLLLSHGADPDKAYNPQRTAYHLAAGYNIDDFQRKEETFPSKEEIIRRFQKGEWNKPEEPAKYFIHLRLQLLINAANVGHTLYRQEETSDSELPPEVSVAAPTSVTRTIENPEDINNYPTAEISSETT